MKIDQLEIPQNWEWTLASSIWSTFSNREGVYIQSYPEILCHTCMILKYIEYMYT